MIRSSFPSRYQSYTQKRLSPRSNSQLQYSAKAAAKHMIGQRSIGKLWREIKPCTCMMHPHSMQWSSGQFVGANIHESQQKGNNLCISNPLDQQRVAFHSLLNCFKVLGSKTQEPSASQICCVCSLARTQSQRGLRRHHLRTVPNLEI